MDNVNGCLACRKRPTNKIQGSRQEDDTAKHAEYMEYMGNREKHCFSVPGRIGRMHWYDTDDAFYADYAQAAP